MAIFNKTAFTATISSEALGFFLDDVQITNAGAPGACGVGDFIMQSSFE